MDTEKGCKSLNRVELKDEPSERSSSEIKRSAKKNNLDQISIDEKEKERALILEERREKKRAYARNRRSMITEEQRKTENAYQRNHRAMATDEQREKTNAYNRNRWVMVTGEQREKRNAHARNRWALVTDEKREKRNADARNRRAMATDEQREKKKAYERNRRENLAKRKHTKHENASAEEKNAMLKDEQNENQKTNVLDSCAKATMEGYEADHQYEIKIEPGDINNMSYLESECIKSPDIVDVKFETSSIAKVDQRTFQNGSLDYLEVCEDWRTRVKIEYNAED